jgi:hypothetical protein
VSRHELTVVFNYRFAFILPGSAGNHVDDVESSVSYNIVSLDGVSK